MSRMPLLQESICGISAVPRPGKLSPEPRLGNGEIVWLRGRPAETLARFSVDPDNGPTFVFQAPKDEVAVAAPPTKKISATYRRAVESMNQPALNNWRATVRLTFVPNF